MLLLCRQGLPALHAWQASELDTVNFEQPPFPCCCPLPCVVTRMQILLQAGTLTEQTLGQGAPRALRRLYTKHPVARVPLRKAAATLRVLRPAVACAQAPASKRARLEQCAAAAAQLPAAPLVIQAAAAPPPGQRSAGLEAAEPSAHMSPAPRDASAAASAPHMLPEPPSPMPPLLTVFEDRPPRAGAAPPQASGRVVAFALGSDSAGVGADAAPARRSERSTGLRGAPPGLGPDSPPGLLRMEPPGLRTGVPPGVPRRGVPSAAPGGPPGLLSRGPAPTRRLSALHGEVLRFAAAAAPTPAEAALIREALWTVGSAASDLWPGSHTVRCKNEVLHECTTFCSSGPRAWALPYGRVVFSSMFGHFC